MKDWHTLSAKEVMERLETSADGLSTEEADKRRQEYGPNELKAKKRRGKLAIFISQFKDIMILILAIAAIISFAVGEHTDAYVIIAIIIGNAIIGYVQEYNAEESIRKLQQMAAQGAVALRNGKPKEITATELVPGDIVLLEAGNIIPADARLIEVHGLKTEEAALTGESHSIDKITETIEEKELMAGDRLNMIFKGTIVSNGNAKAVVTDTGMQTEMGQIAQLLEGKSQKTPLQRRLAKFSKQLAIMVLLICAIVFGYGMLRDEPLMRMFLTALSLAVAALPEALPAVITISLARGAARMVKRNALIRRLPAVETLGSVTYICSDKTGTLTENKMTVEKVKVAEGKEQLMLYAMMLNNEVKKNEEGDTLGDPTEIALVNYAAGKKITKEQAEKELPIEGKIPFDSERMLMSTLHKDGNEWLVLVKGAPGRITDVLNGGEEEKEKWLDENREWASDGLRVLQFAYKKLSQKPDKLTPEILETDLLVLGMVGMIDPPREEVIDAIAECKDAGIETVMITGDQALTAKAIAERLHIIDEGPEKVMSGADLNKMSDEELEKEVGSIRVYARVSPEQKLKIVRALQNTGQYVAMTGDGVNDAPSLKQADIGVAMGITGTDVAKEAAHMVLLDDNFATIVKAVKEGRRIYDNILKFVQYVLSSNLGEILVIFFAPVFGLPIPLLPIHILWINLATDGLPGLALAAEPAEKDIMKQPPRPPKQDLFTKKMIWRVGITGILLTIASLLTQMWAINQGYDIVRQQTMVFSVLCIAQLGNAISVRSLRHTVFTLSPFTNIFLIVAVLFSVGLQLGLIYIPFLHSIFHTTTLSGMDVAVVMGMAIACFFTIELSKWLFNKILR